MKKRIHMVGMGSICNEDNLDFQNEKIKKAMPRIDKTCKMLLLAVEQALHGIDLEKLEKKRVGILIGSAYGVISAQEEYLHRLNRVKKAMPTYFQATTQNLLSGILAYQYGIKGINFTIIDGWTSGLDAVMLGMTYIQNNVVDVIIAGGVDCKSKIVQAYHDEYRKQGIMLDSFQQGEACGVVILQGVKDDEQNNILIENSYKSIELKQGIFYEEEDLNKQLESMVPTYKGVDIFYLNRNNTSYDSCEQEFVRKLHPKKCIAMKEQMGECGAASGILQLIDAWSQNEKNCLILQIGCEGKYTFCSIEGGK